MHAGLPRKTRRFVAPDTPEVPPDPPVTITFSRAAPSGTANTRLGVHLVQNTLDPGGNAGSLATAKTVFANSARAACHHAIRSFGATQLQTAALENYSQINWTTFDRVVDNCQTAGVEIITILGQTPAFMAPDGSDADKRIVATFNDEFATLSGYVTRRMDEFHGITGAKYNLQRNEHKGYGDGAGGWLIEDITDLYNLQVTAVLAEDATAQVGGTYPPVKPNGNTTNSQASTWQGIWGALRKAEKTAYEYFVANADQIDFLSYSGKPSTRDGVTPPGNHSLFERMVLYKDVADYLRTLPGMASIPIIATEWYAGDPTPDNATELAQVYSRYSVGMLYHIVGGTYSTHSWKPEPWVSTNDGDEEGSFVWRHTGVASSGTQMPYGALMQMYNEQFAVGQDYYLCESNHPEVVALANDDHIVVVNGSTEDLGVVVNGSSIGTVAAYDTVLEAV